MEDKKDQIIYAKFENGLEVQFKEYADLCNLEFQDKIPWFVDIEKFSSKSYSVLCLKGSSKRLVGGITVFLKSPETKEINEIVEQFGGKKVFMSLLISKKESDLYLPLLVFLKGLMREIFNENSEIEIIWGVVETKNIKLLNVYKNKLDAEIIDIPMNKDIKIVFVKNKDRLQVLKK